MCLSNIWETHVYTGTWQRWTKGVYIVLEHMSLSRTSHEHITQMNKHMTETHHTDTSHRHITQKHHTDTSHRWVSTWQRHMTEIHHRDTSHRHITQTHDTDTWQRWIRNMHLLRTFVFGNLELISPRQKARLFSTEIMTHSVYDTRHDSFSIWYDVPGSIRDIFDQYRTWRIVLLTHLATPRCTSFPYRRHDSLIIWYALISTWRPPSIRDMTHFAAPKSTSSPYTKQDSFSIWHIYIII